MDIICRECNKTEENWVDNDAACNICYACYKLHHQLPLINATKLTSRLSVSDFWVVTDTDKDIAFRAVTQDGVLRTRLAEVVWHLMGCPPQSRTRIIINDIVDNQGSMDPCIQIAVSATLDGMPDPIRLLRLYPLNLIQTTTGYS